MPAAIGLVLTITTTLTLSMSAATLPVVDRVGQPHVAATQLEREAGIVIKRMPGTGGYVACGTDHCAPLEGVITDADALLVPVASLAKALNLTASFDDHGRQVALARPVREAAVASGIPRLGSIAPNLRLSKLDGTQISLDELRGERVLINSWASW